MYSSSSSNATVLLPELVNLTIVTTAPSPMAASPSPAPATANATAAADAQAIALFLVQFRHNMYLLQLFVILGYGLMAALCVALACYLRYNRNVALKGDATAARKILLPAFEPLMWILAATTGAFTITVILTLSLHAFSNTVTPLASEGFYSGRMVVMLMVVVYMLQKSVTVPALIRTVGLSLAGGTYTMVVELVLMQWSDGAPAFVIMLVAKSLLLFFFTYVFLYPPGRASKRSLREYIGFVYVYYIGVYAYSFLLYLEHFDSGFFMVYMTTMWAALAPLFIWRVLSADTQHWRGMGQRAVSLQSLFRQRHNLNERVSSQGLHVLIEMHRKFIIDFAYLELKHKIGMGATATVFSGVLQSRTPVAIKVYTPSEYHEETVAEFSHEAALCGALNHPNIVKFYGMCVCPPTICLVSELCQGSLDDITMLTARTRQHPNRQQQLINVAYMIDAARAVAYIHSFSPAFVHRDIKPSNFLVDAENTVKLTDFGESRSLPKAHRMAPHHTTSNANAKSGFQTAKNVLLQTGSGASLQHQYGRQSSMSMTSDQPPTPVQLTVKGTVDYMAPEIIQGRAGVAQYGEAADVYSLAITLWDIWNPGKEKFPTHHRNNHLYIFESVVQGTRPEMDGLLHPILRDVIASAWHSDPRLRPSAQHIVNMLESVQEELLAVFAMDLQDELEQEPLYNKYGELVARTFSATQAIDRIKELCFVNTTAEAVRVGNALLDAGLLHHVKHERPFERGDGLYFFDDDNIHLCRPILAPEEGEDEGDETREMEVEVEVEAEDDDERLDHVVPLPNTVTVSRASSGRPSRRSTAVSARRKTSAAAAYTATARSEMATTIYDNGMCQCRKLGQRLEQPKDNGGNGGGGKRRGFRRHRLKAASEETILTAKLLGTENSAVVATQGVVAHDFDDFESVNTNFAQHRDLDGGFA